MNRTADNLLAVDIGNTAIKFGWFSAVRTPADPPLHRHEVPSQTTEFHDLAELLAERQVDAVHVASVCRTPTKRLEDWFCRHFPKLSFRLMSTNDFPISVLVKFPERVGHDRLAAAVCACHIKTSHRPAIVVDAGSAITVDLVSVNGCFAGGAILPGWQTMARALRRETDQLPQLETLDFDHAPEVVGQFTEEAIASGLYWGSVGAVKELVGRISAACEVPPEVMLAGGDMQSFAAHLDQTVRCEPDLVLRGIAIAAADFDERVE